MHIVTRKGNQDWHDMFGCALADGQLSTLQGELWNCQSLTWHHLHKCKGKKIIIRKLTYPTSCQVLHWVIRILKKLITLVNHSRTIIKLNLSRIFTCLLCIQGTTVWLMWRFCWGISRRVEQYCWWGNLRRYERTHCRVKESQKSINKN